MTRTSVLRVTGCLVLGLALPAGCGRGYLTVEDPLSLLDGSGAVLPPARSGGRVREVTRERCVDPAGPFPQVVYSETFTLVVDPDRLAGAPGPYTLGLSTSGWDAASFGMALDGAAVPEILPGLWGLEVPVEKSSFALALSWAAPDPSPQGPRIQLAFRLSGQDPGDGRPVTYDLLDLDLDLVIAPCEPASTDAIVFAHRPTDPLDRDAEIWVLEAGVATRRTHNTQVEDVDPVWSADRSEIAFVSNRVDPDRVDFGLVLMPATSVEAAAQEVVVAEFPRGTSVSQPAWSPVARRVAVSVGATGLFASDLWVINLDQVPTSPDRRVQLTTGGNGDASPTWSPDGASLAFVRRDTIYVIAADGSTARITPLYSDPFTAPAAPHWGAQGFVFQAYDAGVFGYRIARIDPAGGNFDPWTTGGAQIADLTPKWSRDGGRVLFARESRGELARRLRVGDAAVPDGDGEVAGQPAGDNSDPDW